MENSPFNLLALTDKTYSLALRGNSESQVIGGISWEPLPTENVCSALAKYLLDLSKNNYILGFFENNVFASNKDDIGQRSAPAITIFPRKDTQKGQLGWLIGSLVIRVTFPVKSKRWIVIDEGKRLVDYLSLTLNGDECIYFCRQFCFGLTDLAIDSDWDYSKSIAADGINTIDIYMSECVCTYRINMLEYYISKQSGKKYLTATINVKQV